METKLRSGTSGDKHEKFWVGFIYFFFFTFLSGNFRMVPYTDVDVGVNSKPALLKYLIEIFRTTIAI